MQSLRECLNRVVKEKKAIGHFNISNIEGLWAVFKAARKLDVPVIIGTSEGERDFLGVKQAVLLVKSLREEFDYPIFINADHTYSLERVKEAIDAGYDAVIYDGAEQPFEENIKITKQCVEYARSKNPEILIEGELGYKGTASEILDEIPKGVELGAEYLTKPDEAERFVKETGVDLLAPAVGNFHGMLKRGDPALNIKVVKEVSQAAKVPLVLHGASGNSAEDIKAAIENGVSIVHVSTELRAAYTEALRKSLTDYPKEVAPYKISKPAIEAMQKVAEEKLRIFNNL
ncbi:MAG TPA: class II fructose-bisphosphate aldolase [Candidatus Paceibacterota bacterium]|nr:class II fructose-bisphosphate aldolase [Candidatus Paceibacterota bacterium]